MKCKNCGAEVSDNSLVCGYCGTVLGSIQTPVDELRALDELASAAGRMLGAGSDEDKARLAAFWSTAFIPNSPDARVRAFMESLQRVKSGWSVGGEDSTLNEASLARAEAIYQAYRLAAIGDPVASAKAKELNRLLRRSKRKGSEGIAMLIIMAGIALVYAGVMFGSDWSHAQEKARTASMVEKVTGTWRSSERSLTVTGGGLQLADGRSLPVDWKAEVNVLKFSDAKIGEGLLQDYTCAGSLTLADKELVTLVSGASGCEEFSGRWSR